MMNRRAFLKLSAGALVLAAAGGLTGCGNSVDLNHPMQEVDGVVFLCDAVTNDASGGSKFKVRYKPYFAIWNKNDAPVTIPRSNITGTFTGADGHAEPMVFTEKDLNLSARQYTEYNGATFCLETENSVASSWKDGSYELRILYNNKTIVFRYDGEKMTTSIQ